MLRFRNDVHPASRTALSRLCGTQREAAGRCQKLFCAGCRSVPNGQRQNAAGEALTGLGQIERDLGNSAAASRHLSDAVDIRRTQDDPLLLAHAIRHAADILRDQGQSERPRPATKKPLRSIAATSKPHPSTWQTPFADTRCSRPIIGDPDEATLLWYEAMGLYAEAGVQAGVAESQSQIAFLMGR